MVFLVTRRS